MNTTWKAVLGVALIFIFGLASGVLCTSLVVRHRALEVLHRGPEAVADALERRMTRSLDLDADQRTKIHALLLQNILQRRVLQKQIQPQVQVLNQATLHQIDAVLRPDQDQRMHENLDRFKARFSRGPLGEELPAATATNAPPAAPAAAGN